MHSVFMLELKGRALSLGLLATTSTSITTLVAPQVTMYQLRSLLKTLIFLTQLRYNVSHFLESNILFSLSLLQAP